jgi:RNA recognition motif-containing protein
MRERRSPVARRRPPSDGQRHGKHRGAIDDSSSEEQCHPRKIFVGGLAHRTSTQHLREYFGRYGAIVDAVVLRWPDGRSRGFGYVTFADASAADSALQERHSLSDREVDVKRAVPGTNKLFVGGLPQNTSANELQKHFEQFGVVSDSVVMIDPATNRSRGFGFVCYLPGQEGAAAVNVALQQYDNHRIRGKWIEVKSAAPPQRLTAKNGALQDEQLVAPSGGQFVPTSNHIKEVGVVQRPEVSLSAENAEPNQAKNVAALGSPRKVALPTGLTSPNSPPSTADSAMATHFPLWTPTTWNPPFVPGYGLSAPPGMVLGGGIHEPSSTSLSAAESLQRNLEVFLKQTMQSKMESGSCQGTPSVSTTCSAAERILSEC